MQENRYYRYLKFPFEFNVQIPDFGDKNHVVLARDKLPREFVNFISQLNLRIGFSEVFKKQPGYQHKLALHLDGYKFDDHVKINFVINNGASRMCWWRVKDPSLLGKETTVVGTEYYYAAEEHCDLLASAELDRPALVNAGQLHSVKGIENQNRYAFSFMLQKQSGEKLTWDEAQEIFKDYIE